MPTVATTDESAWLAGLAAREPAAVAELSRLLRAALGKSLGQRGGVSHADLDDFAQEATLRVLDKLPSFRGDSRASTWAIAIAVRVALTHLRRRRAAATATARRGPPAAVPDGTARPAEHRELLDRLRDAIETELTDRQRSAVAAFLTGTPQVVLAEQLGMNANAFHKLMHDARLRLRRSLESAGYDAATVLETIG